MSVVSFLGSGCATGNGELRHGRAAGQWQARVPSLPTTRSPIQGLAYGRAGSSEPAADLGVDAALAALDRATAHSRPQPALAQRASKAAPVKASVSEQAPVREPEPAAAELASRVRLDEPVALAQATARDRYAQREAQAQEQQKFAGGDAIVITSGAIVLVLLIVLLVLLLR